MKKERIRFNTTLTAEAKDQLKYIRGNSSKDFENYNDIIEYLVEKEYERLRKNELDIKQ